MVFPQQVKMGSNVKSNDDCYFYYYSSCTKGEDCPYRHCQSALGTETVCSLWKEGQCYRNNCKFRHMESRIDRKSIPCYWENQPGGCRKPHCVFFHRKLRAGAPDEKQGLILPVANADKTSIVKSVPLLKQQSAPASPASPNVARNDTLSVDETDEGIHSPVEPFVVSFDENEESDSESLSNTPVKSNDKKLKSFTNGRAKFAEKSAEKVLDFEVKSLEQIRLEKIHKESENIYKTDFTVPSLEDIKVKRKSLDTEPTYISTSDIIPILPEKAKDDDINENTETGQSSLSKDSDLRSILNQPKKKFNFATPSKVSDSLDFKIKTLDEIRKEKRMKEEQENESKNQTSNGDVRQNPTSTKPSPPVMRKLKINRANLTSTPIHNTGKRKNDFSEEDRVKIMKVDVTSSEVNSQDLPQLTHKQNNQKETVQSLLPFLKRNARAVSSSNIQDNSMENSTSMSETELIDDEKSQNISCEVSSENNHHDDQQSQSNSCAVFSENHLHDNKQSPGNEEVSQSNQNAEDPMESTCAEADSSIKEEEPEDKTDVKSTHRSISIDEIDSFLQDTDVDMNDLDTDLEGDDIMSKINEFLDS